MSTPAATGSFIPRIPSLAGFWARFFALVLDLIFLHYFLRFCSWGLGDLVFHDERVTAVGAIFVFMFYFVSLNGPPGGGSTIGKTILRMRVSTLDGAVPSWGQAIARTLLFFPFVATFYGLSIAVPELPPDPGARFQAMVGTGVLAVATMVGNSVAAAFNPFKQGMHDYAASTVVRMKAETPIGFEEMKSSLGQWWEKHYRQPQYSGRVTFVLVFLGLAGILWPVSTGSKLPLPPTAAPILGKLKTLAGAHLARAPQFLAPSDPSKSSDGTSGTLSIGFELSRRTLWSTTTTDPALRRDTQAFASQYLKELAAGKFLPLQEDYDGTATIEVEFSSTADLILYSATRDHGVVTFETPVTLPANPAMRAPKN